MTAPLPGEPGFVFDPHHPDFERDPYPTWALLREHAPVFFWEEKDAWVLTRAAEVNGVMRDEERFSPDRRLWEHFEEPPEGLRELPLVKLLSASLFAFEGAEHTRLRKLASVAMTRRAVRGLEPLMEQLIDDLLAPVLHRGEVEFVEEIASIYPVTVVSRLLGVPEKSDKERAFKAHADGLVAASSPVAPDEQKLQAFQHANALVADIEMLMEEKRRAPAGDLMTAMIEAESDGDRFQPDEILAMILAILIAGAETTANSMALGLLELLRHPEQLARFRDDPGVRATAAYEIVRYQMPGRFLSRYAKAATEIDGHPIRKGQLVLCGIPSAQRDPALIDDPDRFDITRPMGDTTAFGGGRHYCLGAQLARLELEISLGRVVERLPHLELACAVDEVPYRHNPSVRGPSALPLRFTKVA